MTRAFGKTRKKHLTWRRADRALVAIVELIECDGITSSQIMELDRAANFVRELRDATKS